MTNFDVKEQTNNMINFIKKYYQENNLKGAIIGISGGKDSAVVAALLTKALGRENIIGVTLPCHSKEQDRIDAKLISDYCGFKLIDFELTKTFDCFKEQLKTLGNFNEEQTKNSDINLKPRLRMATLYYLAALYTAINKQTYLVAGTSNKCELFVGYFTKGGDSVHDISLLADLSVEEVIAIGKYMNVPEKVLYKKPSDGLSGKTDEEKLGVTYNDIAIYIEDKEKLDPLVAKKIEALHNNNLHKFFIPTYIKNENNMEIYLKKE